ncbi:nucleotidyltransferase domain-containing protein [Desulfococcaceae bacterium HSG8]|nr:nucleotidyltransferase domain-containing protein [Desulfococcaceae bacterium HSG8]
MILKEWSDNQRRMFIDTVQVYEAFSEAFRKSRSWQGGMHWKKSKGREYLFRSLDRFGNGKSLGPRSPETEKIIAEFRKGKQEIRQRLATLRERIAEQARFCKAAKIHRVPRLVSAILRLLDQENMLGRNVMIAGTHAIFAYEAAAGVFLDAPILATGDLDILWDTRTKLKLAGNRTLRNRGLLGILRKADSSFESFHKKGFRAVNQDGFMVDLIKAEPRRITQKEPRRMGGEGGLEAAEIRNLQWLLAAPKFSQVIIGDDGYPARIVATDPRSFALHKLWLAEQPDREPVKKQRDRKQGIAVAEVVIRFLPNYPFKKSELRMFPKEVAQKAGKEISDAGMPPGFDVDF